ncbi:hypothetical protein LEMLEM_LOCUS13413, partial [Lemmus lemmus]
MCSSHGTDTAPHGQPEELLCPLESFTQSLCAEAHLSQEGMFLTSFAKPTLL